MSLLPSVYAQLATDFNGNRLAAGSTVEVRVVGTSTKLPLFADLAGTTPLANPVSITSSGNIFFTTRAEVADLVCTPSGGSAQSPVTVPLTVQGRATVDSIGRLAPIHSPQPSRGFPFTVLPQSLGGGQFVNNAWTEATFRITHTALRDVYRVVAQFDNREGTANHEGDGPQDFLGCTASLEISSAFWQFTVSGKKTFDLVKGGAVYTDPLYKYIPAGTVFQIRFHIVGLDGTNGYPIQAGGSSAQSTTAAGDFTMGGGTFSSQIWPFGPSLLLGDNLPATTPVTLHDGDSISGGQGDTAGVGGFQQRAAVAAGVASIRHGLAGWAFDNTFDCPKQHALAAGTATHVISSHGTNDRFHEIRTPAIAKWRQWKAMGMRVHQTTVPPVVTTGPANTNTLTFNTWVRDGAPINIPAYTYAATGTASSSTVVRAGHPSHPLSLMSDGQWYFETAYTVEDSPGSGIWASGMNVDGLHPSPAGHAAMAAAMDLTKLVM